MTPLDYDALTAVAEGAAKGSWETTDAELDAFIATFNPETALRLLSAAREAEGLGWQPIETAPRDGTPVLLAVAGEEFYPRSGWFSARFAEWVVREGDDGCTRLLGPPLTHWSPLPAPPALARTAPPADGGKA